MFCNHVSHLVPFVSNETVVFLAMLFVPAPDLVARLPSHFDVFAALCHAMPPHLVPLVEVIQGAKTSLSVVEKMIKILTALGKTAVHAKRDIPGFIGNRMQHALKREAIALVESGVCDAETVDLVVKEGFGQRLSVMGPLENSDLVGLNLTLDIHEFLLSDLDASETPQRLLRDKVMAGELGMSTGKGFRSWTPSQAENARTNMQNHLIQAAKDRLKKRPN